ncbi:MAG: acyl carrier protein [Opitutus sp.]|nr:acyl carrier protein [Opitutus sp.]
MPPEDDPVLREALKRCSPATYYAACKFRAGGDLENLRTVVLGVVERFVDRDRRTLLQGPPAVTTTLRLREDLGLDSLTMMEIIMLAEEVLQFTISNEELTRLCTLGEVQRFIVGKVAAPAPLASAQKESPIEVWDLASVGEHVRRIDASAAPNQSLSNQHPTRA